MDLDVALAMHSRRTEALADAWAAGCARDPASPHLLAWELLGCLGRGAIDATEFEAVVQQDVERHGAPRSWGAWGEHYNRCLQQRQQIFGELYSLGAKLGEGGFGLVVRGSRRGASEEIAVKLVNKAKLTLKSARNLEDEIRLWGLVRHQGCTMLHGVYELSTAMLLLTELCAGGCLLDLLTEVEQFTEMHAKLIAWQVSRAIVYLHGLGIAHRDIKAENVLCTDARPHLRGHVKLCDFGCAAEFDTSGEDERPLQQLIGTPEYLAPEIVAALQLRRRGLAAPGYNAKVDMWALGCLVYEMLVGEPPFWSEDEEEQFELILRAPLAFPAEVFDGVEPEAKQLLAALLDRSADARPGAEVLRHPWLLLPARRSAFVGARAVVRMQRAARRASMRRRSQQQQHHHHHQQQQQQQHHHPAALAALTPGKPEELTPRNVSLTDLLAAATRTSSRPSVESAREEGEPGAAAATAEEEEEQEEQEEEAALDRRSAVGPLPMLSMVRSWPPEHQSAERMETLLHSPWPGDPSPAALERRGSGASSFVLRRDHSLKIQQFRRQRSQRIEASRALCRVETLLPALQGTLLWQPGAAQAADSRESRESREESRESRESRETLRESDAEPAHVHAGGDV